MSMILLTGRITKSRCDHSGGLGWDREKFFINIFIQMARSGIVVGLNKGHQTTERPKRVKPSYKKGVCFNDHIQYTANVKLYTCITQTATKRSKFVKSIVREVAGFAPYERRVMELLKNSKDKRARRLAKKRVCDSLHGDQNVYLPSSSHIARNLCARQEKSRGTWKCYFGNAPCRWSLAADTLRSDLNRL